jgi:hypothetical protein
MHGRFASSGPSRRRLMECHFGSSRVRGVGPARRDSRWAMPNFIIRRKGAWWNSYARLVL